MLYKVEKHIAGEDQLPQESANVTKGSDHSSPNMLLAFISSCFGTCLFKENASKDQEITNFCKDQLA